MHYFVCSTIKHVSTGTSKIPVFFSLNETIIKFYKHYDCLLKIIQIFREVSNNKIYYCNGVCGSTTWLIPLRVCAGNFWKCLSHKFSEWHHFYRKTWTDNSISKGQTLRGIVWYSGKPNSLIKAHTIFGARKKFELWMRPYY